MAELLDLVGGLLLVAGAFFCFAAALGLVRFPDPLTRMHAATKPSVFGLLLLLTGVSLVLRDPAVVAMLGLAVALQVMTAPISGHLVSRSAYRRNEWGAEHATVDELADDNDAGRTDGPHRPPAD